MFQPTVNSIHPYATAPRGRSKGGPRNSYHRYPKPPYSYVGMIVMAIETSPNKCLLLNEIHHQLQQMFSFFSDSYTGWKDSVRHNLSYNNCFYKVSAKGCGRGNLWGVNLALVPPTAFRRQDTAVSKSGNWAMDLHLQLGVPEVVLPECALSELTKQQECISQVSTNGASSASDSSSPNAPEVTDDSLSFGINSILKVPQMCSVPEGLGSEDDTANLRTCDASRSVSKSVTKKPRGRKPSKVKSQKQATDLSNQLGGNQYSALHNLGMLCHLPFSHSTPQGQPMVSANNPFDDSIQQRNNSETSTSTPVNIPYGYYPGNSMYGCHPSMYQYPSSYYMPHSAHMMYPYPPYVQHPYSYHSISPPAFPVDLSNIQSASNSDCSTSVRSSPTESVAGSCASLNTGFSADATSSTITYPSDIDSTSSCAPSFPNSGSSYTYTFLDDIPSTDRGCSPWTSSTCGSSNCSSPLAVPLEDSD